LSGHTFDEPNRRERHNEKLTENELLEELRRLADSIGRHPPTKADMDKYGEYYGRSYQLRFGSWSEAIEEAGFEQREGIDSKERPDACRICDISQSGLDFHHWRYGENKIGCYLCRDCHDKIHEGKADRSNVDWLHHSVRKLVHLHIENGGKPDLDTINRRYSLPNIDVLVERAIESYDDEAI